MVLEPEGQGGEPRVSEPAAATECEQSPSKTGCRPSQPRAHPTSKDQGHHESRKRAAGSDREGKSLEV